MWEAAWNDRDIERVLAHFDENVVFTSPTALAVVGVGTVRGKEALRSYWTAARVARLRFTVDRVVWDPEANELAIVYRSDIDGKVMRVSEQLRFGPDDLVEAAEVFHGVAAAAHTVTRRSQ